MLKEKDKKRSESCAESVVMKKIEKISLNNGNIREITCLYIDRADHENGDKAD